MATKTRKPAAKKTTAKKATAKKTTAKKATAKKAPAPKVQTTGKGRTTPALANRHRWSDAELKALVKGVQQADKAGTPRMEFYRELAAKIGNGITPESVRAYYYPACHKLGIPVGAAGRTRKPKATAQGAPKVKAPAGRRTDVTALGEAPTYGDDPVKRVQAMVKRRGALVQAIQQAQAELDQIDSVLGAIA